MLSIKFKKIKFSKCWIFGYIFNLGDNLMIEILEVKTNKQKHEFVNFPINLYKDCKYYVPSLKISELSIFNNNSQDEKCVFYLAKQNGIVVGRIGGIIHNLYNEKTDQKRVRFTRFDCINSFEVAQALFSKIEEWAKNNGMNCVHGPMGFNDLEKMGIQVSDFNKEGNIITQYNFPYYKTLIEKCGYTPEASFVECKIMEPNTFNIKLETDDFFNVKTKHAGTLLKKYKTQVFDLINECYIPVYGAVPITPKLKEKLINTFKFLINLNFISIVVDKQNNVVGFGLAIPGIAKELKKSKGSLLSMQSFKMIKSFQKPNYAEILFVCVSPKHQNEGIEELIASKLLLGFRKYNITTANTNPIIFDEFGEKLVEKFEHIKHKKRVAYIKLI